jgi:hypothetical protein
MGVEPSELADPDLEVHCLPSDRELAGLGGVPVLLRRHLHALVCWDPVRAVVEAWKASALEDL